MLHTMRHIQTSHISTEEIDMDAIILAKMDYNKTRPYKHGGKVC